MEGEWIFEGPERQDILAGIHLLANAIDKELREIRANFREADTKLWLCRLAEARDIARRESLERP